MLAERIVRAGLGPKRLQELLAAVSVDGELLVSLGRSLTEAAWRGEVYLARAHAVEARRALLEILRNTAEAQELAGAEKMDSAKQAANGGAE